MHKTHINVPLVPRLDMCRSILSLRKIAHQIWCDHPISQRNNRKSSGGRGLKWQESGGVGVGLGRQYGGGVFIKQGGQHPSANYVKSLKKFPISAPIMKLPPPHSWLPPFLVKIPPAITAIFEKFHPPLYEGWAGVRTISISQQF